MQIGRRAPIESLRYGESVCVCVSRASSIVRAPNKLNERKAQARIDATATTTKPLCMETV